MQNLVPASGAFYCLGGHSELARAISVRRGNDAETSVQCFDGSRLDELFFRSRPTAAEESHGIRILHDLSSEKSCIPYFRDSSTLGRFTHAILVLIAVGADLLCVCGLERRHPEPEFSGAESERLTSLLPLFTAAAMQARSANNSELPAQSEAAPVALSRRERESARLLLAGYTIPNIAANLDLSENTVRTYVRRLYKKLDASNRADFVRQLVASGGVTAD